jgi:uncharacterized membrane protein YphA (DoxX/SURF4 family)
MSLVRLVARPMIASLFVYWGVKVLRDPQAQVAKAEPVTDRLRPLLQKAVPQVPNGTTDLVRLNAGVHAVGGSLLALGWFPRTSSLALAATMLPTTVAGHPFWKEKDKEARSEELHHFLEEVAIMGGLLIAGVDTQGRPGVGWRARRAARDAKRAAKTARREAKLTARAAKAEVGRKAHDLVH